MIKITVLIILQIFFCIAILSGLGVIYVPPPVTEPSEVNQQPLTLPSNYNPSYVLGIYDGGHKSTTQEYRNGIMLGLAFNSLSFIAAPLSTPNSRPEVIPTGVNQEDYIKGYRERSASLNRHAAFKGAVTGSVIQTAAIILYIALTSK